LITAESLKDIFLVETEGNMNINKVKVNDGDIKLTSLAGDINTGNVLSETGDINMDATDGDINLGMVNAQSGDIQLIADKSITNSTLNNNELNIQGDKLILTAEEGSIGSDGNHITTYAYTTLNAWAFEDIYLNEKNDNFISDYLLSETGSIGLLVPEGKIKITDMKAKELLSMESAGDISLDNADAAEFISLTHDEGASLDINLANIVNQFDASADNIKIVKIIHLGSDALQANIQGGSKKMADLVEIEAYTQKNNKNTGINFKSFYADNSFINARVDDLVFDDMLVGSRADIYNNYYYVIADNLNMELFTCDMQLYPEDKQFYLIMASDKEMLTNAFVMNYNPDFIVNDFSTENNFVRETNKMPQVVKSINTNFMTLIDEYRPLLAEKGGTVLINPDSINIDDNTINDGENSQGDLDE